MEEAAELANYLPLSFKTPKEQEYIEFLWDAFETNHTYGKYQSAFLAYHMLTMSFVYFNIWQIKQTVAVMPFPGSALRVQFSSSARPKTSPAADHHTDPRRVRRPRVEYSRGTASNTADTLSEPRVRLSPCALRSVHRRGRRGKS